MILVAILTIIIIMAPDCGTGRVLTTTMPPRWPHLTGAADYTNNQQVESKKFNFDYDGNSFVKLWIHVKLKKKMK